MTILLLLVFIATNYDAVSSRICSTQITQGPFLLQEPEPIKEFTAKNNVTFLTYKITKSAEVLAAYRSYWKSYCYNGGPLDPNTGCIEEHSNMLPDKNEATEWVEKGSCRIQKDCINCWGTDSTYCLPGWETRNAWHYVKSKELIRATSNNHFAFHTCNMSWRCGLHTSNWETYLNIVDGEVATYILSKESDPIYIGEDRYFSFKDFVILIIKEPTIVKEYKTLQCHGTGSVVCYDTVEGNLIELKKGRIQCFESICYEREKTTGFVKTSKDLVNLKAASIEDLRHLHEDLLIEHESTKYNMLLLEHKLIGLQKTIIRMISSLAKIDDRLIGEILTRPAQTKFLSKEHFLVSPCSGDPSTSSNCNNGSEYIDGRWTILANEANCVSFNYSKPINLWERESFWIPELVQKKELGTISEQEGWSFIAKEKNSLKDSLVFSKNMGETSSLGDAFNMPRGSLNNIISTIYAGKIVLALTLTLFGLLLFKVFVRLFC